jgi:hypothetical protein
MKTILVSVLILCPVVWAQTQQHPTGARLAELFQQWDLDGDGKITKEEAAKAPWLDQRFDRLDRNKNGILSLEELGLPAAASTQRPARGAGKTKPQPVLSAEAPGMKRVFTFTRDYTPGTRDANGKMRSGQELMRILTYRGQLFASTSTFTDPRLWTEGDPEYTGCQVLRKSNSKAEWQVEASFGKRYLRTDYLEVVRFTKDADGRPLAQPVEMLVATLWDLGEPIGRNRRLMLVVRDDATGQWTLVPGASVPDAERGFVCIRSLKVHTDKVTGMEYLFMAAGCGGMYKSVYDPSMPGKIRWLEGDELDKSYGRGQSMCAANGDLYVSYDYGGLLVQNQAGGVFRRIDGPQPRWECVYRNYDPKYPTWNQTGRGITAVPAEDGSGKEVVMVGIENPPEPILVRIEPHNNHRAVVELNYNEYFTRVFGRKPQMLGGSAQSPHAGCEVPALNRFDPFINPETGKLEHFVTLFLFRPDDCNNAYFLIRRAPGEYDWGEVTSDLPAGESLRGTRTIEKSPFPDEPNTYYFGGCCAGPDMQPARPNLAWIYKGVVGARERGTVKASPLPPRVPLVAFESAEHGFSFSYPKSLERTANAKPLFLAQATNREAPTVLADAVAASSVKEAVAKSLNKTFATRELEQYTERNEYFAPRKGVAGNIGGRVVTGKRFTFQYVPGPDQPAIAAVGVGWTKGGTTAIIVMSYWGDYTEAMANYQLNTILATLTIK